MRSPSACRRPHRGAAWPAKGLFGNRRHDMNGIIYIVGLVVIVIAVASYFGLA
jgi:hypothetical protein